MGRQNLTYYLAERPVGDIVPGKTFEAKTEEAPTADQLKDGQVLVEAHYLSLDPALRGYLDDARSYEVPVAIGERMRAYSIARVLASKSSKVKEGDLVATRTGWTEVAITDDTLVQVLTLPPGTKPTDVFGVLGHPAITALMGLEKIGKPKAGETIVVSSAAGATGSVVGQLAKISGARVIGLTSSEEKCAWLRELGYDVALNYKSPTFKEDFAAATPEYINVYWDNVGGEILDMALSRAAKNARFVMCGAITLYNAVPGERRGIQNLGNVIKQRIHMEGFIVLDHMDEYPAARMKLAQYLGEGKLQRRETIVTGGLKNVEQAFLDLFKGKNTGKMLLEVKPL